MRQYRLEGRPRVLSGDRGRQPTAQLGCRGGVAGRSGMREGVVS